MLDYSQFTPCTDQRDLFTSSDSDNGYERAAEILEHREFQKIREEYDMFSNIVFKNKTYREWFESIESGHDRWLIPWLEKNYKNRIIATQLLTLYNYIRVNFNCLPMLTPPVPCLI